MRVLITGIDGYLGWPLSLHLKALGHEVVGIDAGLRRRWVAEVGGKSALPIARESERFDPKDLYHVDLTGYDGVRSIYHEFQPECIIYLGEQPSAPYSMRDCSTALDTQLNNVLGTLVTLWAIREACPDCHLLKLGTMGEYGTPDSDIPEGYFPGGAEWTEPTCGMTRMVRGDLSGLMFPRRAGSFYHLSKVHDTHNVEFACRTWGLRSTDVMQGIVYGTRTQEIDGTDPGLFTRLDFDECFGTVINRFVCQAILGTPLTIYGTGGQTRGFLPLHDSITCLTLALENPPDAGQYRTFNQFAQLYSVADLAERVAAVGTQFGLYPTIQHVKNPRIEAEAHRYEPDHDHLRGLGYAPVSDLNSELRQMFQDALPYQDRIKSAADACFPRTKWG